MAKSESSSVLAAWCGSGTDNTVPKNNVKDLAPDGIICNQTDSGNEDDESEDAIVSSPNEMAHNDKSIRD